MPDYIYLLENRLSADQRNALHQLRNAAREAGMLLFLTGDAVRDLTSGHAVRDIEVAVQGNALKLKKPIERLGGKVWGEDEALRSLYLCFPGTVRIDVVSTHRREYPKPGKPIFHQAAIQEDLRRRDFTVNAMAISLNEGSFGLLMDPTNGAADIESRTLRLVSNYSFLEQPSLLVRATRYRARLGWEFDPRTQTRYENAREEGVIEHMAPHERSFELEQIGHEDDGLKVLRALEAEGWMKVLFPAWTSAKADEEKLKALHELAVELLMQGIHSDMSAAQMQLLTARLTPKDLSALKKQMLRPGFVEEWNSLDAIAAAFAKALRAKENQTPSAGYRLFTTYDPEAVLWLGFTSKDAAVQERYNLFLKVWPDARQRIPYALMQEMRITPELPIYAGIVQQLFLELIDGRLTTPEEMRAFLEPHSPPAPPPQVTIKRSRAKRGAEAKIKERSYEDEDEEEALEEEEDLDDIGGEEEIDLGLDISKEELEPELIEEGEHEDEELEAAEPAPPPVKTSKKQPAAPKVSKEAAPAPPAKPAKKEAAKTAKPQAAPAPAAKPASRPAPKVQVAAKKSVPAVKTKPAPAPKKPAPAKGAKPAKAAPAAKAAARKAPAKASVKAPAKAPVKAHAKAKTVVRHAPAKKHPTAKPAKPAAKKPAPKPAKKR
ncbi:MAG: CCA tRNA nucleotidyltransferase [Acidobacteriota bacterium]|nr:CCA tRNA nucleotidyltransferase [Acidobacteriota bacterium]